MRLAITNYLQNLLNIGVTGSDIKLAQKLRQLNLLILIALFASILYFSVYIYALEKPLAAKILIPFFILYLATYWFSDKNRLFWGKIWIFSVYLTHIFLYSAILFSKASGFHFFFFILPPVLILIFDNNELVPKIVFTFLAAFLFFLAEIMPDSGFSILIDDTENQILYYISMATCFGGLVVVTGIFDHEITVLESELSRLATRDPLTQILNRRQLFLLLEKQFDLSRRYNSVFSTILIDIDFFKKINDTFGHKCGDEALIWISKKIAKSLRNPDIFARYGGEEFCIILPETPEKSAFSVSEKLRAVIEKQPFRSKAGHIMTITVSCGVCTISSEFKNYQEIIHYADKALYRAKRKGRNRSEVWFSENKR